MKTHLGYFFFFILLLLLPQHASRVGESEIDSCSSRRRKAKISIARRD
jgi:hypothetical protein